LIKPGCFDLDNTAVVEEALVDRVLVALCRLGVTLDAAMPAKRVPMWSPTASQNDGDELCRASPQTSHV
jgi:hypothetical protein